MHILLGAIKCRISEWWNCCPGESWEWTCRNWKRNGFSKKGFFFSFFIEYL